MSTAPRKITYSKYLFQISIAWLVIGIALGHLLSFIIPSEIGSINSYTYIGHLTENSRLVTSITIAHIALLPIAIILITRYGFTSISIPRRGRILLLIISLPFLPVSLGFLPASEGTKYHGLAMTMATYLDWFGASLFLFLFMWAFAFSVSAACSRKTSSG
jgi:hypothetical protein